MTRLSGPAALFQPASRPSLSLSATKPNGWHCPIFALLIVTWKVRQSALALTPAAPAVLPFWRSRRASFFADSVRGTDKLKAEVETGLWELVAAGLVSADGFDNLRALIDPKRRSGQGSGRSSRPRHSTG